MDIKDAIKRINAIHNGESIIEVYDDFEYKHEQLITDWKILANHFAKQFQDDDDEIIDEDWLISIGFSPIHDRDYAFEMFVLKPSDLKIWDFNGDYWVVDAFDQAGIKPGHVKTRGQLRQLIRFLH
jgi:hypothetical protein